MSQPAAQSDRKQRLGPGRPSDIYAKLYRTPMIDRNGLITTGVAASDAGQWLDLPDLGRNITLKALDLSIATFNKKVKSNAKLSPAESQRVIGFARLVGQVDAMVEETGTRSRVDARAWLSGWLADPLPALGNARPIDFMNTMERQGLVSQTLAQIASGAYA